MINVDWTAVKLAALGSQLEVSFAEYLALDFPANTAVLGSDSMGLSNGYNRAKSKRGQKMIIAQNALDTPKVLLENLDLIRDELGPDWAHFHRELAQPLGHLAYTADSNVFERAVSKLWQICCRYPFVKGLIFGYGIGYSAERSTGRWRKLKAADFGDETFVREVANRFQSLSDRLKEIERPESEKPKRESIRFRGC